VGEKAALDRVKEWIQRRSWVPWLLLLLLSVLWAAITVVIHFANILDRISEHHLFFAGTVFYLLFVVWPLYIYFWHTNNSLQNKEQLFYALAETTTSAIFFYREKFLYVNQATVKITGYSQEELIGMYFWEIVHPDFREMVKQRGLARLAQHETLSHYTFSIVRKDGAIRWIDFSARRTEFAGQPAALGTAVDITLLKKTEVDLQQNIDDLTALYDASRRFLDETDIQATLKKTCSLAVDQFGVKMAWVGRVSSLDTDVHPVSSCGFEAGYLECIHIKWDDSPLGQGPTGRAIRLKQPIAQNHIDTDPAYAPWRQKALERGYRSSLALPLLYGGSVLGVLNLYSAEPDYFSAERSHLFQAFANLAALALQRSYNFAQEEQQRKEAETLREVAAALTSTIELKQLLPLILAKLSNIVTYDSAAIALQEGDRLRLVAGHGFPDEEELIGRDLPAGDALFQMIRRQRRPVWLDDAQQDARFSRYGGTDYVRGWLGVPLIVRGEVIGYLTLDSRQAGIYGQAEADTVLVFAYQVAQAITNARLYDSERRARRTAETLRAANIALSHTLDLDMILTKLLEYLEQLVPYDSACVMLLESKSQLRIHASRGYGKWVDQEKVQGKLLEIADYPNLQTLVHSKKSFFIPDVRNFAGWHIMASSRHIRSWLGIPLIAGDEVIGAYSVDKTTTRFFTVQHQHSAEALAAQAAVAIQNARLYAQLRQQADQLEQRVQEQTAALQGRVGEVERLNRAMHRLLNEVQEAYRKAEATAKQLQEVNADLEAFAYSVSHDLRAPLRSIKGFAEILAEDYGAQLDAEGRRYLRRVIDASQRMDRLIVDLLSYSRLVRREITIRPVDLGDIVEQVLLVLSEDIREKGAEIHVQKSLPVVQGQPSILEQVLLNLVHNALKFVAPGVRPQVHITAEKRDGWARLWVEDNGIGIANKHQQRIFQVFERLHHRDQYPGNGIGLATVKKGVERLGGRVGVVSEEGKGSRFWLELPLAR